MLKSSILTSLELLADKKKHTATGTQPDSTPTPGPSPEFPLPTPSPSGSGEAATPAGKTGTGETTGLPEIGPRRRDELFRLNNGYYDRTDRTSESAESGASGRSGKTKSSSPVVKPADQVKTGTLVMTTDSGKSGVSSNGLVYDPKTGQSVPGDRTPVITQTNDPAQGIPDEYADLAEIVAALPDEFDLTDWDEKTTREQRKALENSGLSAEEQMALLSAGMSVETIATIQDIQANHTVYGLTQAKADSVSNELLQIAVARADVQSHKVPLFSTPQLMRTFLTDLDKKEADLLAPFISQNDGENRILSASSNKVDNRVPLEIGTYIGYSEVDITNDLNQFMYETAEMMKQCRKNAHATRSSFYSEFYHLVETGGPLDIKRQKAWQFRDGLTYYFNGIQLRNDDPGNIAFGYYGAAVFGREFLQFGAGLYQLRSDIRNNEKIQWDGKYFDNPHDSAMIEYGYNLYMEEHGE